MMKSCCSWSRIIDVLQDIDWKIMYVRYQTPDTMYVRYQTPDTTMLKQVCPELQVKLMYEE